MAQNVLDTVNFSTVPVTYTAGHSLKVDDANWLDLAGGIFFSLLVSSPNSGIAANTGGAAAARSGFTWTDDQFSQMTLITVPSGYGLIGLRIQTGASNGYVAGVNPGGFNRYRIYRMDNGVLTSLQFSTRDPTVNDVMNFQIVGSNLTLDIGNGTEIITASDATYATGGNPGVLANHSDTTTKILSTWTAGSVGAAAPQSSPMFRGS